MQYTEFQYWYWHWYWYWYWLLVEMAATSKKPFGKIGLSRAVSQQVTMTLQNLHIVVLHKHPLSHNLVDLVCKV